MMIPLLFVIIICFHQIHAENSTNTERSRKQLSVFTVVKFPNDVCVSSTSGRNGTCYTSSECSSKGGSSSGSCASSFGVCCIFEKSCGGGSVAENCTYFTSSSRTAGSACSITICKSGTDVCQLRLDFESFTLSNPVTSTAGAAGNAVMATTIGTCVTDFFSVSAPGGKAPPLICGENSGYHMYVPASDQCNALSSYFGTGTTTTTSAFVIKLTQIKCNAKNRAPDGCLQYFTSSAGTLETFNYNSGTGVHLVNQDYCKCIRAERTTCTVCYSAVAATPGLGLGRPDSTATISLVDTMCGYHAGVKISAKDTEWSQFDHVVIPNSQCPITASSGTGTTTTGETLDRYCGTKFICVTAVQAGTFGTGAESPTICSSTKPFQFCLKTDGQEAYKTDGPLTEVFPGGGTRGFSIRYWQSSTCLMKGGPNA